MIPRSTHAATNITTASDAFADPALLVELAEANAERQRLEALDPLARLVAAMERLRPAWHRDPTRGCADMTPEMFVSKAPKVRAACFDACGRCPAPIRRACAQWAIEVGETVAIAGGMDGPARRPLVAEYRRLQAERNRMSTEGDVDEWTP